jgi:hypothetical protein
MRDVAWNEVQAMLRPKHHYEYVLTEQTPGRSQKTLNIDTPQGTIELPVSVDGKPPSEKQCRRSRNLLLRITSDKTLQESRLKSQRTDEARRAQLFSAMPQAFLYQYLGVEKGTGWIRLAFRPNPKFRPRTRVGGVLPGLQGVLWVDPGAKRLVRIQGSLIHNVTMGWGILARIYSGGRFLLEQARMPDGSWQEARLWVNLRVRILLFKKLAVHMTDSYSSFKRMPDNITLNEAVNDLEHQKFACGE